MEDLFWQAAGPLIADDEPSAVLLAGMTVGAADGMLVNVAVTRRTGRCSAAPALPLRKARGPRRSRSSGSSAWPANCWPGPRCSPSPARPAGGNPKGSACGSSPSPGGSCAAVGGYKPPTQDHERLRLAGARSFTAIAEWAADADQATRGITPCSPYEGLYGSPWSFDMKQSKHSSEIICGQTSAARFAGSPLPGKPH